MNVYFGEVRERIYSRLIEYIRLQDRHGQSLGLDGFRLVERLESFALSGKMIRGGLVIAANELKGAACTPCVVDCAAAVELYHSASLIHDDIIDRDVLRRGHPTIHAQFSEEAEILGASDPKHFGSGMGICAGDIAIFLAYQLLSEMDCPMERKVRILSMISSEARLVALAQMRDIQLGGLKNPDNLNELTVMQVYRFKTARYTFSVPLTVGAILAGIEDSCIHLLDRLGEKLGVLFQLRDDELGLFGEEGETGKPVGSDIREGKKTLHYVVARDFAKSGEFPAEDWQRLSGAWGDPKATADEVAFVRRVMEEHGVIRNVRVRMSALACEANEILSSPIFRCEPGEALRELVEYNLERRK
jgi:geranylgeranyl diphosphate synthase type I